MIVMSYCDIITLGVGLFQVNNRGNIVKFKDVDGLNVFCFKEKIKGFRSQGKLNVKHPLFCRKSSSIYPMWRVGIPPSAGEIPCAKGSKCYLHVS